MVSRPFSRNGTIITSRVESPLISREGGETGFSVAVSPESRWIETEVCGIFWPHARQRVKISNYFRTISLSPAALEAIDTPG